jgi:hypothetical protein
MAFPFTFIFSYYQTFSMVLRKNKDTVEISKRIQKYTSIEETKESFVKGNLVSSVVGGWAHCAPSPTTRVAGHAGVAGHAVAAA